MEMKIALTIINRDVRSGSIARMLMQSSKEQRANAKLDDL
jgi:hypothetical protein